MKKPIDQNLRQAVQFLLFSCTAGVIQTISFALFSEVCHFPYWPSYLIALIFSVVYNFTVNRRFTFRSAANVPAAMMKVFGYYCVFTPLSTWWGDTLTKAGWNDFLVLFGTMVINLITEFLFCRFVVYRNSIDTNAVAEKKRGKSI